MDFYWRLKRNFVRIAKVERPKKKNHRGFREWENSSDSKAAGSWLKDGRIQSASVKSFTDGEIG